MHRKSILMKKIFYYTSTGFAWIFLSFFCFLLVFSLLGFAEFYLGWDVPFVNIQSNVIGAEQAISVSIPFVNGSISFPANLIVLLPLIIFGFYTLYFFQLARFFKVFIAISLFSSESIKALKRFLWYNLIIVIVAVIALIVLWVREGFKMDESILILVIHGCVALLVYLYLDMALKGNKIQQENDLTI